MAKIKSIKGLEILDSRGTPTVEVILETQNGVIATAKVPSGASTGEHEAIELRDKDPKRYFGKGVSQAIKNINGPLQNLLIGKNLFEQEERDREMIAADGTENKSNFGANAILGISMAIARAAAMEKKEPLYAYLSHGKGKILPCPMMNIINGGAHADSSLDIQEFMIRPIGASSFSEALRMGAETFQALKKILKEKGYATSVGDEGGFAPKFSSETEALETILQAIEKAGYKPKKDISIALDLAASEFFDKQEHCYYEKKKKQAGQKYIKRNTSEQVDYIIDLVKRFPIDSIEDGLDENDWEGFSLLTEKIGNQIQIVGDDLLVTNTKFLKKAIEKKAANAILIKLNQIGTLTETLEAIQLAMRNNWKAVISHRSGETEDSFIADLAVATDAGQIKTGSLSRSDRIAKYNRLLEIESELGKTARYMGK